MATATRARTDELAETRALYETTQEICSRLDLDQVLMAIARRAREMVASDVAYLGTNDEKHQLLRVRAYDGVLSDALKTATVPYGIGLGGRVAALRRPVSTDEYFDDHELQHDPRIDAIVREEGMHSVLAVPIEFERRLLGVLFVAKRRKAHFTQHQRTLLSSLGNSAAIAINNAQIHSAMARAMEIHNNLMELVLSDSGMEAVARTLAKLIQGPVLLLDWFGQPLASSPYNDEEIAPPDRAALAGGELGVQVIPVTLGVTVEGFLVVRQDESHDELARVAVEQATTVFALELAKLRSAEQAELQARGDVLDDLLTIPMGNEQSAARRAGRLGLDLSLPYSVAVARLAGSGEPEGSAQLRHRLIQVAMSLCRREAPGSLVLWRSEAVVFVIPGPTERPGIVGNRYVVEARSAAGSRLVVGIGGPAQLATGFAAAYEEAVRAVEAACALPRLGDVVRFADLDFHQLVLGTRPAEDLNRMALRVLQPILTYDTDHRGSMLETISTYLDCGGNLEATARRLGIHANTMRNRVQRISTLLNRDLTKADTRLDLHLAVKVSALSAR